MYQLKLSIVFTIVGVVLISLSLPYITNKKHTKVEYKQVLYTEKIPGYIYLKLETINAFMADNPINVSIQTGIIVGPRGIQLTFDGAGDYFPGDYNFSGGVDFEELKKQTEVLSKSIRKNIIPLEKHTNPVGITHFTGYIQNLSYKSGGNFDIGITLTQQNGNVVGYEMGERDYRIEKAIQVSPRETLLAIKSNNLMIGLAWIAISIAFLIPGLGGLLLSGRH